MNGAIVVAMLAPVNMIAAYPRCFVRKPVVEQEAGRTRQWIYRIAVFRRAAIPLLGPWEG